MKNINSTQSKKLVPSGKANPNNLVVQSNELIQASYAMTLNEQRLLLACISQIDSRQMLERGEKFTLTVEQAQDIFYSEKSAQNAYRDLADAAERLFERKVRIALPENKELLTRFVQSVLFEPGNKQVAIEFANEIIPYLSQLEANFTKYRLANIVQLTSSHAVRIYELIVSWAGQGLNYKKMEIKELRGLLGLENKYKDFKDFNRNVTQIALKQINDSTDFMLKVSFQKRGRSYKWIQLEFDRKADAIAKEEARKARKLEQQERNQKAKAKREAEEQKLLKQLEELRAQQSFLEAPMLGKGTILRGIHTGNEYTLQEDGFLAISAKDKNYSQDGLSASNNFNEDLQKLIQTGFLEVIKIIEPEPE